MKTHAENSSLWQWLMGGMIGAFIVLMIEQSAAHLNTSHGAGVAKRSDCAQQDRRGRILLGSVRSADGRFFRCVYTARRRI